MVICMNSNRRPYEIDHGPYPYVTNVEEMAMANNNYRSTIWTGTHLQLTLMSIPPYGEIGLEIHEDVDQMLRVEQGKALVCMRMAEEQQEYSSYLCPGDVILVPAKTWHNIMNVNNYPLKLTSVYAPVQHPPGTIHRTKAESDAAKN